MWANSDFSNTVEHTSSNIYVCSKIRISWAWKTARSSSLALELLISANKVVQHLRIVISLFADEDQMMMSSLNNQPTVSRKIRWQVPKSWILSRRTRVRRCCISPSPWTLDATFLDVVLVSTVEFLRLFDCFQLLCSPRDFGRHSHYVTHGLCGGDFTKTWLLFDGLVKIGIGEYKHVVLIYDWNVSPSPRSSPRTDSRWHTWA